jgi:hypothetical protein
VGLANPADARDSTRATSFYQGSATVLKYAMANVPYVHCVFTSYLVPRFHHDCYVFAGAFEPVARRGCGVEEAVE